MCDLGSEYVEDNFGNGTKDGFLTLSKQVKPLKESARHVEFHLNHR